MANIVKFNASSETRALRSGNFWLAPDGGINVQTWWSSVDPPGPTGYTVFLNKSANGPSMYQVDGGAGLISLTNRIKGGSPLSTAADCVNYYMTETDKMILNQNYGPLNTLGLQFAVDSRSTLSWNGISGTDVYDMSSGTKNSSDYTWANPSWSDDGLTALTICCLIRMKESSGTTTYPINKLNTTFSNAAFGLRLNATNQLTWVGPGASAYTVLGLENFVTLVDERLTWVGLQFNSADGGRAWLNGGATGSRAGAGILGTGTGALTLTQIPYSNSLCEIVQVAIYNRELSDVEMQANYQATIAPPAGSWYGGGIVFATGISGNSAFVVANEASGSRVAQDAGFSASFSLTSEGDLWKSAANTNGILTAAGAVDVPAIDWALDLNSGGKTDWVLANFGAVLAISANVWKPNLLVGSVINGINYPAGSSIVLSNKSSAASFQGRALQIGSTPTNAVIATGATGLAFAVRAEDYGLVPYS